MVPWLPESYAINQVVIIFLDIWAIVQRDSTLHLELVCILKCDFHLIIFYLVNGN